MTPPIFTRPALDSALIASLLQQITQEVTVALSELGSSLVVGGVLEVEFSRTLEEVLGETVETISEPGSHGAFLSVEYAVTPDFQRIAATHAERGNHPAEALMAAEVIFGVALPLMSTHLVGRGEGTVELATALHHALWRRFPPGAIAYVEVILAKLAFANQDSRRRVASELHDRIAHQLAAGIQRIELAQLIEDPAMQPRHLESAVSVLHRALEDVQDIAVGLRQHVGDRNLDEALAQSIKDLAPTGTKTTFTSSGKRQRLQPSIAEEILTIVLEAVRNARRHAEAELVTVAARWTPRALAIEVMDDGSGFVRADVLPNSLGLLSMEERGVAIGASLVVETSSSGTRILLELPLTGPGVLA